MDRARECHFTIEAPAPAEHLALAWKKSVALIGLKLALYSMNRGQDWYDKPEQWEKNVYWHIDVGLRDKGGNVIPLRIPSPSSRACSAAFPKASRKWRSTLNWQRRNSKCKT